MNKFLKILNIVLFSGYIVMNRQTYSIKLFFLDQVYKHIYNWCLLEDIFSDL